MSATLSASQQQLLEAIRVAVAANGNRPVWAAKIRQQLGRPPTSAELRELFLAGWVEMKPGGQETRKIVTVVFTDVVGSTALGERLEPRRCTDRGEGQEPPLTAWRVFGVWPDAWPLSDHRQRGAAGRACGPTGTP